MNLKINIPKLGAWLTLLLIGYNCITEMQWEGVGSSSVVALGMLLIAAIAVVLLLRRPLRTNSIAATLLLFYLYIVFASVLNGYTKRFIQEPTLIVACAFWIFVFWLFYEIGKKRTLDVGHFQKFFIVLTFVAFVVFCRYYAMNKNVSEEMTGLNVVYYLLFMFPIILMCKNKKIVYIGIVLNVLAVLLSGKRGALIAVTVAVLVWFLTDLIGKIDTKKIIKTIVYVVVGYIAIIAVIAIADRMDLNTLDRMQMLITGEDEGGSGRADIWTGYFDYMRQDGLLTNLFGRGYNAPVMNPSLKGLGIGWAHNDFLQMLFDYGVVGLVIFITFVVKLFAKARQMKRFKYQYYRQFLISLIIFVLCCSYSMVTLNPQWFLAMVAFWGLIIGDFEQRGAMPNENSLRI